MLKQGNKEWDELMGDPVTQGTRKMDVAARSRRKAEPNESHVLFYSQESASAFAGWTQLLLWNRNICNFDDITLPTCTQCHGFGNCITVLNKSKKTLKSIFRSTYHSRMKKSIFSSSSFEYRTFLSYFLSVLHTIKFLFD